MGAPFFGPTQPLTAETEGAYEPEINLAAFTPWDVIVLGSTELSLVRSVRAHKAGKVDNKGAPAMTGAQPSHLGYEPGEIELTLEMWTEKQQRAWEAVIPALQPRHGKKAPLPVDVKYPSLGEMGIRKLYPARLGALEPAGKNGLFRVQVWFTEYAPLLNVGVLSPKVSLTDINQTRSPQQTPPDPSTNAQTIGPH